MYHTVENFFKRIVIKYMITQLDVYTLQSYLTNTFPLFVAPNK